MYIALALLIIIINSMKKAQRWATGRSIHEACEKHEMKPCCALRDYLIRFSSARSRVCPSPTTRH